MSRSRDEVDGASQEWSGVERIVVGEGVEVTLPGLRELLGRIEHQRLGAEDWSVFESLVSELIAEAGDREIVSIEVEALRDDRSGSIVEKEESTHDCERWASPSVGNAPTHAEPQPQPDGAHRRG